ncbi:MAG: beta-galactosidase [Armatimonadetes bacterium]|nr:beta-galactosidase [Armatimonadota bacterium]
MLGLLLLAAAALAEPATKANWIWYPEDPAVQGAGQTRYLRRSFTLEAAPTRATLRARWDDGATFTINGQPAPRPAGNGRDGSLYDLTSVLKPGENVLGFAVMNSIGVGGLILSAEITTADRKSLRLYSDTTWRAAKEPAAGWDAPGFDDRAWPDARIVGNVFAPPWYRHPAFDMEPFLSPGEAAEYAAWRAQRIALPPGLDREKDAAARFVQENDHCALRIDGRARPPLLYRGTVDPLTDHGARQIALFRDAGVHVFAAYYHLAACRPKPGVYDFSRLDEVVRAYLATDPRAYLVLVLHLVPPTWWMDQNPDDLVRYAAGDDYNSTDEALRVRVPSLASSAWFDDSADLWRRCLKHLEGQPWGKRIIGYQPGYGIYTEWHYYGSWTEQMPDIGAAMTRHFRGWLARKYRSDAKLQAAWADPRVMLATAEVPHAEPRVAAAALGLRDPRQQAWAIDYYRCQQELTAQRVEQFCGLTKDLTGGRALAGAFYGYYEGVTTRACRRRPRAGTSSCRSCSARRPSTTSPRPTTTVTG